MSASLARLRAHFEDDLLVLHGKKMVPTAYAETLRQPIAQLIRDIDALLMAAGKFDPLTSRRSFKIVASDYVTASVMGPLLRRFAAEAPGITLEIMLPSEEAAGLVFEGKADLVITPQDFINPDHPSELLCEEEQVILACATNSAVVAGVTADQFSALGHVAVHVGSNRVPSFADRQIARMGLERRIEVTCGCFTMVPWMVQGTNRIAVMHRRLAQQMVDTFDLVAAPLPFNFPIMQEMQQYHRSREDDDGLRWLRKQLQAEAALQLYS